MNDLVRQAYRNEPVTEAADDKMGIPLVINEIQKTTHSIVKFMSNRPVVRVPLPRDTNKVEARYNASVRERILQEWWKEMHFSFKYHWMQRDISMFGYQPTRLQIFPRLKTKVNMMLDSVDKTVGRYMYGCEPELDFYGTSICMTGDMIWKNWLKDENDKSSGTEKIRKGIENNWETEYEIAILINETDMYVVARDTSEVLEKIPHNFGFVPALLFQNFPQPKAIEGISDVAHIVGKNQFINILLKYAIDYLNYQTNPILFGKMLPSTTDLRELRENGAGGVNSDDERASLEFVKYPPLNAEFENVLTLIKNAVIDETGVSEMATSARTDMRRIDAGTTVNSLNMGLEALLHLKRDMFSTYMEIMNARYLEMIDRVYRPELYRSKAYITLGTPLNKIFQFSGADINGVYDNQVVFLEGQFDMAGRAAIVMRQVESKLLSKKTARSELNIHRPEAEEDQIKQETMEELQFAMMLKQIEQGGQPQMPGQQQGMPEGMPAGPHMMPDGSAMNGPQGAIGMDQGAGMPPQGMMAPGASVAPELANPQTGMMDQEIAARFDNLSGLKGVAKYDGMRGGQIIVLISDLKDKQTILEQLPEYREMIQWVHVPQIAEMGMAPPAQMNAVPMA